MQLRLWLVTAMTVGAMLMSPAIAADEPAPVDGQPPALELPQACVEAGVATEADCTSLLAGQKAAAKKAAAAKAAADGAAAQKAEAEKAAAEQLAADKAAAKEAAAQQAAAEKAAAKKAAADQIAADKAAEAAAQKVEAEKAAAEQLAADKAAAKEAAAQQAAAEKAAAKKAAADQIAADKAAAQAATADKAAADQAAADKAAADQAAADKAAAQDAAAKQATAEKAAAKKAAADKQVTDKAAADAALADKAAADQAATDKSAADQAAAEAAANKAASDTSAKKAAAKKAAADKLAADKAAAADQAAAGEAAAAKATADQQAADKAAKAAAEAPADAPAAKPSKKSPRVKLAQDCLDAGIATPEDCDALHAIAGQTAKAKPAPNAPAAAEPTPVAPVGPLPAEVTPAKAAPETPAEPAAPAAPALPDIAKGLNAAAKSHNRAVAALSKPDADPAATSKARAKIDAAAAEIDALCKTNKFESSAQCLAQFGIELAPVPSGTGSKQVAVAPAPAVQPVEVIDKLPKGVKQEDVAPLLDSAKDQVAGKGPAAPTQVAAKPLDAVQVAALAAPPPKSDKAAQAGLTPAKLAPIDQQKGQALDANAVGQVQVPQNVTIVTQNIVNNTTNTTTTNNTQINNAPAAPGKPTPAGQPGKPDKFRRGGPPDNPIGLGIGIVLQFGNQTIVSSPAEDHRRIAYNAEDRTSYERLPFDRFRETVVRSDGVRIVTIYNRNGDILRRSRIGRDGREIVIAYFDDTHERELLEWHDPAEDLPPLRLHIPAREYVLDADGADEVRVQKFFAQPPVERVRRLYSIAEVKRSSRVRDMVRRLEIGDLTFNTGAATISKDQVGSLAKVAGAMLRLLGRNPGETFLIEGHTDAVGNEISNLQLSDARAATIARILTDYYDVPPENLATQGYGERYLKVDTELPERLNRRVTVRRITSLVTLSRN